MIDVTKKEACCGCGACAQSCPAKSITMKKDNEGFLYPSIDETTCVHCNICEKVCPVLKTDWKDTVRRDIYTEPKAYGGWHKDERIRADSSSGGAFTLFAEEVLKNNGVVYGAAFSDPRTVSHMAVRSIEELAKLRGSKYVQSDLHQVYSEIKNDLKAGKTVLFTGTPCQNAGLLSFLGHRDEKLYLMDFICHGVPSPEIFAHYTDYLQKANHSEIVDFRFRLKDKGWNQSGLQLGTRIRFSDGNTIRNYPALRDSYMNGFLEDIYLRPSCYSCQFKKIPKYTADITIADFWGVDKAMPKMNDGKGTSLVLIHSGHGQALFDRVEKKFVYQTCPDWKKAVKKNGTLLNSAAKSEDRQGFYYLLNNAGYEAASKRYLSTGRTVRKKAGKIIWKQFEKRMKSLVSAVLGLVNQQLSEDRWQQLLQFMKFCMVGVSNVVVSYTTNITTLRLISLFIGELPYDYVIANTTAFIIAVYWSYFWNSRLVFSMSHAKKAERRKALLKTYVCYGFTGIILNNILSTIWITGLGISKYISPLLNLFITIPVNYLTNKYWAYAKKDEHENE